MNQHEPHVIPDLQSKFDLLIARGLFHEKKEIADTLGKSIKTINWWAHGDGARTPGQISTDSYERVIDLFVGCFPAVVSRDSVVDALSQTGPVFTELVARAWAISWDEFVAQFAELGNGRVVPRRSDTNLVEIDGEQGDDAFSVRKGAYFKISFSSDLKADHTYGFQQTAGVTARLPVGFRIDDMSLHLPGLRDDSTDRYMRERTHLGPHRFVALQLCRDLPPNIGLLLQENILIEQSSLAKLVTYLVDIPRSSWRLFALNITVDEKDGAGGDGN